jgi:hypothetical protein
VGFDDRSPGVFLELIQIHVQRLAGSEYHDVSVWYIWKSGMWGASTFAEES